MNIGFVGKQIVIGDSVDVSCRRIKDEGSGTGDRTAKRVSILSNKAS
jgi:hypothetical protein